MSAARHGQVVPIVGATNQGYLEMLAGDQWPHVLVASFIGDPADPTLDGSSWRSAPAGTCLHEPNFDAGNTYWCPMLFRPGVWRRQGLEQAVGLIALTFDDVGTGPTAKVSETEITSLLRCGPTYLIETSPGNFQAGWKTTGMTDMAWVKGMLAQLDRALGGKADNLTNPIAWRRLPVGRNMKAGLGLGPQGWRVRARLIRPDRVVDQLDFLGMDGVGTITPMTTLNRGTGDGQRPDDGLLATDPVYQALNEGGRIVGDKITSDRFWAATIRCPWIAEHGPTRPLSGAEYVPAIGGQRGWFHCFHCERRGRNQGAFREQLDVALRDEGQKIVAAFEFDDVDPALVPGPGSASLGSAGPVDFATGGGSSSDLLDPWDAPAPPAWPGDVHAATAESEIAACAGHYGFDYAGLASALLAAGSAAADKRIVLRPYQGVKWTVPPIVWIMLIGESGSMKTAIWDMALAPVQKAHHTAMARWEADRAHYWSQPPLYRQLHPAPEMKPLLINDATVESVQTALSHTPRGMAYFRDELSAVLDFDRYAQLNGGGQSSRAFFLESYEARSFTLIRIKRGGLHLKNCGLMIGGGIQPDLVRLYLQNTGDGLMQRFGKVRITRDGDDTAGPAAGATPFGVPVLDAAIERILTLAVFEDYALTPDGEALIRETQAEGRQLARSTGLGPAFAAEAHKMHGLTARVALVLHLLDDTPDAVVIPTDTVRRAKRFVNYLMAQSAQLYGGQTTQEIVQAIASWLLRQQPPKITTRDLQRTIARCRTMTTKELNAAIEPLVDGGWVKPAEPYPTNRVWSVNPNLQARFPQRLGQESARVVAVKEAMNRLGQFK
jgi:hypothetical protein